MGEEGLLRKSPPSLRPSFTPADPTSRPTVFLVSLPRLRISLELRQLSPVRVVWLFPTPESGSLQLLERDRCGVPLMLPATVNLLLNLRVPVPWENEERRRRAQEKSPDLVPCLVFPLPRPAGKDHGPGVLVIQRRGRGLHS